MDRVTPILATQRGRRIYLLLDWGKRNPVPCARRTKRARLFGLHTRLPFETHLLSYMERVAASSQAVCCTLQPLNARLSTLRIALTPGQRFRFGRHAECEQSFPSDYRISSLHASLLLDVWDDGTPCIAIEDSSINGTYINAERVPKGARLRLRSGDQLFLVIPSEELLHATGYEGSLVAKFIGYVFSYDSDVTPAAAPVGRLSGRFVPASEKSAPEDAMGETDPCSSQAASSGTPSSIAQMTAAARAAAATAGHLTACSKLAPAGDLITCFPCAEGACCGSLRRRRRSSWPPFSALGAAFGPITSQLPRH